MWIPLNCIGPKSPLHSFHRLVTTTQETVSNSSMLNLVFRARCNRYQRRFLCKYPPTGTYYRYVKIVFESMLGLGWRGRGRWVVDQENYINPQIVDLRSPSSSATPLPNSPQNMPSRSYSMFCLHITMSLSLVSRLFLQPVVFSQKISASLRLEVLKNHLR